MNREKGFTLIEILLVVAAIAILAGIVILAINPGRQLAQTRNAQRHSDINTILNAVSQYVIDNNGQLPVDDIASSTCEDLGAHRICAYGQNCATEVVLDTLADDQLYLTDFPNDPSTSTSLYIGYSITRSANNRITVCAPNAELGETISVTR